MQSACQALGRCVLPYSAMVSGALALGLAFLVPFQARDSGIFGWLMH